jgi:hypothetical protein
MVLDVDGDRLDANFIDEFGNTLDFFTIIKDAASSDNGPPTPPANLTATDIIDTSVTLAWDAATDNVAVTAYRISRDGQVLSTANVLSYRDSTLQPTTTYSYSVHALDAAGNESIAASLSVTTLASSVSIRTYTDPQTGDVWTTDPRATGPRVDGWGASWVKIVVWVDPATGAIWTTDPSAEGPQATGWGHTWTNIVAAF